MNSTQPKGRKPFSPEREARTTAAGMWRFAEEYRSAAEVVNQSTTDAFSAPAMYLIGHSVELSLKAFLRSRGATLGDLLDIGHGLQKLHTEALRRGLQRLWPEATMVADTIRMLDEVNENHAMRYIINETRSVPQWWVVSGCALGLTRSLYRHCLRRTFGRHQGESLAAVGAGLSRLPKAHNEPAG
jgi:hypothetical protein